jgi:hypothetical protein
LIAVVRGWWLVARDEDQRANTNPQREQGFFFQTPFHPRFQRAPHRTVVEGGRRLWEELPDPTEKLENAWMII